MGEAPNERYGVSDDEVDIERVRLAMLDEAALGHLAAVTENLRLGYGRPSS